MIKAYVGRQKFRTNNESFTRMEVNDTIIMGGLDVAASRSRRLDISYKKLRSNRDTHIAELAAWKNFMWSPAGFVRAEAMLLAILVSVRRTRVNRS